jgi:hypothetical protein
LLTASHCIEQCLNSNEKNSPPKYERHCPIKINGQTVYFNLIKARDCTWEQFEKAQRDVEKNNPLNEFQKNCLKSPDVAVLKPILPITFMFKCLTTAKTLPKLGESVTAFGFPKQTSRPVKQDKREQRFNGNAPGYQLVASSGKVINQKNCRRVSLGKENETPSLDQMNFQYTSNIQTTVDIYYGSSGGALINSSGEIVGVASLFDKAHSSFEECEGSTFFAPIDKFLESLSDQIVCNDKSN